MEIAAWFQQTFGDRYFIEIQNNGLEIQRMALEGAVDVAQRMGLPLVATSDAHYVNREDAEAQDVLLCINTGRFRTDTNRMRMEGNEFYLRGPEEMYAAFPGLRRRGGTQPGNRRHGERSSWNWASGTFPTFDVPAGKDLDRLPARAVPGRAARALRRRARICAPTASWRRSCSSGWSASWTSSTSSAFPNYFLIVWDFVRFAAERNIPATARGSGVGSLVAYALRLSHVCPLKYDLLFERFLDISRLEAPDIDIDFCKDRRGEVIHYVKDKYGAANVAQIGTFGTLAARAAIRDVGRALGLPIPRVDRDRGHGARHAGHHAGRGSGSRART